jgi:hypothetical protein
MCKDRSPHSEAAGLRKTCMVPAEKARVITSLPAVSGAGKLDLILPAYVDIVNVLRLR